jgi:hypothetical protein
LAGSRIASRAPSYSRIGNLACSMASSLAFQNSHPNMFLFSILPSINEKLKASLYNLFLV